MPHRLLLIACLTISACAAGPDAPSGAADATQAPARLTEGTWSGGLTPMNHPEMVTPLTYEVSYEASRLSIALHGPGSAPMPARHVALEGDTLRFVFDEPDAGIPLECALGRHATNGFAGRCTDAHGKWAHFTMTPPAATGS